MSTNLRIATLARAAAIAAVVAVPAVPGIATSAYANDAFGSDPAVVQQSARSAFYANPDETPLARATAAAQAVSSAFAANRSGVASDALKAGGPVDLNGQGGQQDQLGREIYHPGSGTDW